MHAHFLDQKKFEPALTPLSQQNTNTMRIHATINYCIVLCLKDGKQV